MSSRPAAAISAIMGCDTTNRTAAVRTFITTAAVFFAAAPAVLAAFRARS
jgi:hypothetical protein